MLVLVQVVSMSALLFETETAAVVVAAQVQAPALPELLVLLGGVDILLLPSIDCPDVLA